MNLNASTTPVPVLAPGNGKTRTGRLWTYLRDVLYRDTPDRKGERCREHLSSFSGHLHADGFAELYEGAEGKPANVNEVACWVHVRASSATCTRPTALPSHARRSIGSGRCSTSIAAKSAEKWRAVRQSLAKEKLDNLAAWLDQQLTLLSGKSALAGAIRYARSRWGALTPYRRWAVGDSRTTRRRMPSGPHVGQQELALCGQRCRRTLPFLAALRVNTLTACVVDGPINGIIFRAYVEQFLVQELRPGDIVVLDNLGSHRAQAIRDAIRAAGAKLAFLPPYSPNFNPIEQVFAKVKRWLRMAQARSIDAIHDNVATLVAAIRQSECATTSETPDTPSPRARRMRAPDKSWPRTT